MFDFSIIFDEWPTYLEGLINTIWLVFSLCWWGWYRNSSWYFTQQPKYIVALSCLELHLFFRGYPPGAVIYYLLRCRTVAVVTAFMGRNGFRKPLLFVAGICFKYRCHYIGDRAWRYPDDPERRAGGGGGVWYVALADAAAYYSA